MDELYRNRAFADAGSDALDRTVADISDNEDTRHTSFKERRIAVEGPALRALAFVDQILTGEDEATIVALDKIAQPFGARKRADVDVHALGGKTLHGVRGGAENRDFLEMFVAVDFGDFAVWPDFDIGRLLDLV